jgi:hypothetical protein
MNTKPQPIIEMYFDRILLSFNLQCNSEYNMVLSRLYHNIHQNIHRFRTIPVNTVPEYSIHAIHKGGNRTNSDKTGKNGTLQT